MTSHLSDCCLCESSDPAGKVALCILSFTGESDEVLLYGFDNVNAIVILGGKKLIDIFEVCSCGILHAKDHFFSFPTAFICISAHGDS